MSIALVKISFEVQLSVYAGKFFVRLKQNVDQREHILLYEILCEENIQVASNSLHEDLFARFRYF